MHAVATAEPLLSADLHSDELNLLHQVLSIYSVRDIVARLHQAGFAHWSPTLINRIRQGKSTLPALSTAERDLFERLLPSRPAHYDAPAFRFVDLFAGIGGFVADLSALVENVSLPVSGIKRRFARTGPTITAIRLSTTSIPISARSRSLPGYTMKQRSTPPLMQPSPIIRCCWQAFLVSPFRWLASVRRMHWVGRMGSNARRRVRCFLM